MLTTVALSVDAVMLILREDPSKVYLFKVTRIEVDSFNVLI